MNMNREVCCLRWYRLRFLRIMAWRIVSRCRTEFLCLQREHENMTGKKSLE